MVGNLLERTPEDVRQAIGRQEVRVLGLSGGMVPRFPANLGSVGTVGWEQSRLAIGQPFSSGKPTCGVVNELKE